MDADPYRGPAQARSPAPGPALRASLDQVVASWVEKLLFPVLGSMGLPVIALLTGDPVLYAASGVFVLGLLGVGGLIVAAPPSSRPTQPAAVRAPQELRIDGWVLDHLTGAVGARQEPARTDDPTARALHPEPASLASLVNAGQRGRLRRPAHSDFLHLRVGASTGAALAAEGTAASGAEGGAVPGRPVVLPLRTGTTTIVGPSQRVRALARAVVAQLVAHHSPGDVCLALAAPSPTSGGPGEWEHTKWLPHVRHPAAETGADLWPLLLAASAGGLVELLAPELERRRRLSTQPDAGLTSAVPPALVLLVDVPLTAGETESFADGRALGVSLIVLVTGDACEPPGVDVSVRVDDDGALTIVERTPAARDAAGGAVPDEASVIADALSVAEADALARRLAPSEASPRAGEPVLPDGPELPALLGIADVGGLDARRVWRDRPERELLRVPIGLGHGGRPVELEIKGPGRGGAGPHALVVGAGGSGKSGVLRSVVTALALTHHPRDLALTLVDVSGGATFAGAEVLPHVAGSITATQESPDAAARTATSLRGELRRRERLLEDSSFRSIGAHREARRSGRRPDLPCVPHMLVVVDEVSALLARDPDIIALFVTIERLGPRLGMYLLLATERPGEVRRLGLEADVGSRIALPDPSSPRAASGAGVEAGSGSAAPVSGWATLTVGTSTPVRFRVATVSTPYVAPSVVAVPAEPVAPRAFEGLRPPLGHHAPLSALGPDLPDPSRPSTMVVAANSLARAATVQGLSRAARARTAPLPTEVTLARLVGDLARVRGRGFTVNGPVGSLRVPLGVVDLPDEHAQRTFIVDLASAGGHLGVVGPAGSGKSVALATLVTSLAITHTPVQAHVYCLDLGGGSLGSLASLPHVGAVAARSQPDSLRCTVAHVGAVLDARRGVAGDDDGDGAAPHVFLVVDGWSVLSAEHADLEAAITGIAAHGAAHRVHVVIAGERWTDLGPNVRDLLGTRLELTFREAPGTARTRADANGLPSAPGRMVDAEGRRVQVALPQVGFSSGLLSADALGQALGDAWPGPVAVPVGALPST